ncbi:MAG TPA: hypothetical protein VKB76_15870 [Ktedonobacterales bacterium]|nr:hypothetical protein [Ktedonobacterales bacterium]
MSHNQSIFAATLVDILSRNGRSYSLDDLRRKPFSLDAKKIDRLIASNVSTTTLPALAHGDLMTIVLMLKLGSDERRLLYGALIALGAQRMLLDYGLPSHRAWEIAVEVRDTTTAWLEQHGGADDLLRRSSQGQTTEAGDEPLLAAALEAYDRGVAQQALAFQVDAQADNHVYLEQALVYLRHADVQLQAMSPASQNTEGWRSWHADIATLIEEIRQELE